MNFTIERNRRAIRIIEWLFGIAAVAITVAVILPTVLALLPVILFMGLMQAMCR